MKKLITSIALIAALGTTQAAGPEDVLLGIILGGFIGNSMARQPVQPPVIVQQPPVIFQPQPQIIYQPLPPQPICHHMPSYNMHGQFMGWRTHCR